MNSDGDCERGTFQVDVSVFKKMVRMLELKRRQFFESDWKNCSRIIPRAQFNHLMLVRFSMPCNLGTIMGITGLTSAGASLFVDKLVNAGVLKREEDPDDRRNIVGIAVAFEHGGSGTARHGDSEKIHKNAAVPHAGILVDQCADASALAQSLQCRTHGTF